MDCYRSRLCIFYVITSVLIGVFIYTLISTNIHNLKAIESLRLEVQEIAQVVMHSSVGASGETKNLAEVVDEVLKKRLSGIWDDLYNVKKQLKDKDCMSLGRRQNSVGDLIDYDRVNYASEELGAKIHEVIAQPVDGTSVIKKMLKLDYSANPPVNMLTASMEPGSCFAFKHSTAEVTVKLAKEIFIETIELAHISKTLSPTTDVSSAPKRFSVYGIDCQDCKLETPFGSFEYDTVKPVQEYSVKTTSKFIFIKFKFEENHGHPEYTCVYRVAVYGRMK